MSPRSKWKEQLQQTSATTCLRVGKVDDFPLSEVQLLTETLLQTSPTGLFQAGVEKCTQAADEALSQALQPLHGRLRHYESGLLATLHAFTPAKARHLLVSLVPDPEFANDHFDDVLAIYLQCVILAYTASRDIACDRAEYDAARELFALVKAIKRRSFEQPSGKLPVIWNLLRACGQGHVNELIPVGVVLTVIRRSSYGRIFRDEVLRLQRNCEWYGLHKLTGGVSDLVRLPDIQQILAIILPPRQLPALASWRPNIDRLKLWSTKLDSNLRAAALPIISLEGPDTNGQQQSALKHSSPGAYTQLGGIAPADGVALLEQILQGFDKALMLGQESTEWVLFACARNPHLKTRAMLDDALQTMDLVCRLGRDTELPHLKNYMNWLEGSSQIELGSQITTIADVIPVIGSSPKLQEAYGRRYGLERQASDLLTHAQQHFCVLLVSSISECRQLGTRIRTLGRAMLEATWMHGGWRPTYLDSLRRLPTEGEIRNALDLIHRAEDILDDDVGQDILIAQRDFLAERVGGSYRPGHIRSQGPPVVEEENPWLERYLDPDRAALRETMLHTAPNMPTRLFASCIEQSLKPMVTDDFIRDLNSRLGDTDQACVNLANFLGPRMIPGTQRTHECWAELLMHMMRQRPAGMLERCDEQLSRETWGAWVKNLGHLYGEAHLGPAAGLGFTANALARVTRKKRPPMRVVSAATTPAGGAARRLRVEDSSLERSLTTTAAPPRRPPSME